MDVRLVAVDETALAQLVHVATTDADPDEVTPPLGEGWTADRTDWLRAYHRDRRAGLDGPLGEATWAVVVDGAVVGAARLRRTAEPGVADTGLWLARAVRGRSVGRHALAAVLELAGVAGVRTVVAETATGNAGALGVLRRLGFTVGVPAAGRVAAIVTVAGPGATD